MENNLTYIRYVVMEDAPLILDWENNEEFWAVSENDSPYQLFDVQHLIMTLQKIETAKQARWMICLKENDKPIGCVDLTGIDFEKESATVGILISDRENRRKGFASTTLRNIEDVAKELKIKHLKCTIHEYNAQSIVLFEKSNYARVGESFDASNSKDNGKKIIELEKWLKK